MDECPRRGAQDSSANLTESVCKKVLDGHARFYYPSSKSLNANIRNGNRPLRCSECSERKRVGLNPADQV